MDLKLLLQGQEMPFYIRIHVNENVCKERNEHDSWCK